MNPRFAFCWTAAVLSTLATLAQETAFTYQGRLLEGGAPAHGEYSMRFHLHATETEDTPLAPPLQLEVVPVSQGLFTVRLDWGTVVSGAPGAWLEIEVRTNAAEASYVTLTPRQQLTPAPRALAADSAGIALQANSVASGAVTSETLAPGAVLGSHIAVDQVVRSLNGLRDDVSLEAGANLLLSATGPSSLALHSLSWGLQGNAGTDPATQFIGTIDETPLELRVNAERVLRLERSTNSGNRVNVIAGHSGNTVPTGFTGIVVAGGGADFGYAEGDWTHRVESDSATISGGMANRIATNSTYSVIGGGFSNSMAAYTFGSVISGGRQHRIDTDAERSTIAGGLNNTIGQASAFSTIGGGWTNQVHGIYTTIAGGVENYIGGGGHFSSIGGGSQNRVEAGTITGTIAGGGANVIRADSRRSSIGGGKSNEVHERSPHSTIAGGLANIIGTDAEGAVIPGGLSNRVDGANSLAAGQLARASHPGTFVWADGSPYPFASNATNELALRATGGFRLVSGLESDGTPLAGVVLPAGSGSWSSLSDREAKTAFEPVDPDRILRHVNQLPLQTWRYRTEAGSARHLGPTAQDFHQAFGLGTGDRTISTVDADGVSLAAIQGLYRILQRQQEEIRQLRSQVAALEPVKRRRSEPPDAAKSEDPASE